LHANLPTFGATKLKGFTVIHGVHNSHVAFCRLDPLSPFVFYILKADVYFIYPQRIKD